MDKLRQFSTKNQLSVFFLLTYLLSWWSVPVVNGQLIPQGPALAALVVLAITVGRRGLRDLWHRISRWRVAWYWYVIGPAIIVGYNGVAVVINLLLGATIANHPYISMGTFLELLLVGGWWEEAGWSGFALPKLQERFADRPNGWVIAALVLGIFRGLWHLPLFLYGYIPWFDIFVFNFAFQLIIAWVFNRSSGSVLVVMLLHFISNLMGSFMSPVFTGPARMNYTALFMTVASLIALVIAWKFAPTLGQTIEQVSTPTREYDTRPTA